MKMCTEQNLIVDYFFNELDEIKKNEFEKHLAKCEDCRNYFEAFVSTAPLIKRQKRIKPESEMLELYYQTLKTKYPARKKFTFTTKDILDFLIIKPPFPVRIAEATILIMIGIFIGRTTLWKAAPVQQIINGGEYTTSHISKAILNNYLQETEMILLDVINTSPNEDDQVLLSLVQLAQYGNLLQKTSLCRAEAKETHDDKLINLIDDIELILLELCNIEKQSLQEKIVDIREQIKETNLLFEINNFSRDEI
jgi:hypothetical protein